MILSRSSRIFFRNSSSIYIRSYSSKTFQELTPNSKYYFDPNNRKEILENLRKRQFKESEIRNIDSQLDSESLDILQKIPNRIHPQILNLTEPKVIDSVQFSSPISLNESQKKRKKLKSFDSLAQGFRGLRTKNTSTLNGDRSYFLTGPLAELEVALIHFTVSSLLKRYFRLISVPDILDPEVIRRCGMPVDDGERTQVYKLKDGSALSGTAEMALGAYFSNRIVQKTEKVAAVSRCYRAEVSTNRTEGGIYRVHNFTKVEMFGVCSENSSDSLLEEFLKIQRSLFDDLNLSYRVLDMSPDELGDPAARKFDIEAILPKKKVYGEISSCSNCTDYQSRRLNIRNKSGEFVNTVNGTACAIPRMIMAIVEQRQLADGSIEIPIKLRPFFKNKTHIYKNENNFPFLSHYSNYKNILRLTKR